MHLTFSLSLYVSVVHPLERYRLEQFKCLKVNKFGQYIAYTLLFLAPKNIDFYQYKGSHATLVHLRSHTVHLAQRQTRTFVAVIGHHIALPRTIHFHVSRSFGAKKILLRLLL